MSLHCCIATATPSELYYWTIYACVGRTVVMILAKSANRVTRIPKSSVLQPRLQQTVFASAKISRYTDKTHFYAVSILSAILKLTISFKLREQNEEFRI